MNTDKPSTPPTHDALSSPTDGVRSCFTWSCDKRKTGLSGQTTEVGKQVDYKKNKAQTADRPPHLPRL